MSSPDCDLRGLEWMPLETQNLIDSTLWLESDGWEFKAAMGLILRSWRQVPAGSLPNSELALSQLASVPVPWEQVRTMAMRNWVLCSDDRWYHPIVAAKAMEALPMRQEFEEKKSADAVRKQRERDLRRDMFAFVRERGQHPEYNIHTRELRTLATSLGFKSPKDVTPPVTPPSRDRSRLGQGQGQGPDPTGIPSTNPPTATTGLPPAGAVDDAPEGEGGTPFENGGPHDLLDDQPAAAKAMPPCPHVEMLKLWAEVMPECPQHDPDEWGGARADNLKARWREKAAKLKWQSKTDGLTYFRRLFTYVRKSDFLMGRVEPRKDRRLFVIELAWLVAPNNWPKVLEGKYHEGDKE